MKTDKIIQIAVSDEADAIFGLSESGRLYQLDLDKEGAAFWTLTTESPTV